MLILNEKLSYPNPQFIRTNWSDLNGDWDFYLAKNVSGVNGLPGDQQFTHTIRVPYSYTFKKSGLDITDYYPVVWYRRHFAVEAVAGESYLLHFEAIDYECDIWLNGYHLYHHRGGHTPFKVDITSAVQSDNVLLIRVVDHNRTNQPIGKQKWKKENFLCWYTRTIGIWQNVWLETTGSTYIDTLIMVPAIHDSSLKVDLQLNNDHPAAVKAQVSFHGAPITAATVQARNGRVKFSLDVSDNSANFRLHYWSPDEPNLYDIDFTVVDNGATTDHVNSYFGMRGVEKRGHLIYLNDQAIYQKLILNQGYYPDGGLTGSIDDYQGDLTKLKAMGFNGNRIHQHIESHRMLYLCDKLGVLAWAEFPSSFEFSAQMRDNMLAELPAFVAKHINHPSVIAYVLMNESWGVNEIAHNQEEQSFVDALYYLTKSYDGSRLVIGNDGWEQTKTDICTVHDYNGNPDTLLSSYQDLHRVYTGSPSLTSGRRTFCDGYQNQNVPFILSEYGGIAYEKEQGKSSWGYGKRMSSKDDVLNKIRALTKAVMAIPDCCGFCYTQLTDVEQEVNGLLDHNHEYKFDPAIIKDIMTTDRQYGFSFN